MADLARIVIIKMAGPMDKHCSPVCPLIFADQCTDRESDDIGDIRTPECLREAFPVRSSADKRIRSMLEDSSK